MGVFPIILANFIALFLTCATAPAISVQSLDTSRQSVARHLGLDTLDVEVATPGSPGKVAAGKYVRENVYVSAAQELGGDKQQEYSVEYQISSNWQLKGSTESGRNSGIDLFWHKRY